MEPKEKVSGDSGRNDILVRLPFYSEYRIVGAAAVRSLAQSQFLDPGRVKSGDDVVTMVIAVQRGLRV